MNNPAHPDPSKTGSNTQPTVAYCPHCGTRNPRTNRFCANCGNAIPKLSGKVSKKRSPCLLIILGLVAFLCIGTMAITGLIFFPTSTEDETSATQNTTVPISIQPPRRAPQIQIINDVDGNGDPGEVSENSGSEDPAENSGGPSGENSNDSSSEGPQGRIVYSCIVDGFQQVCMINADGSSEKQITYVRGAATYPTLANDGQSIIYTSNETGDHAIYEMNLVTGDAKQLTEAGGDKAYPEVSPDGRYIAYSDVIDGATSVVYIMNRDGSGLREVFRGGQRPSWSPDSQKVAFICFNNGPQICVINADGSGLKQVTHMENVNIRASWSPDGNRFVISVGKKDEGNRKICVVDLDGNNMTTLYEDGDAVTPHYSPDGNWIVFTNYKVDGEQTTGEIFIMRRDGTDIRRLTVNERTDWLPFWGR